MKPTDYKEYALVYDLFSNPQIFPLLNDFIRLVNDTVISKKKLGAELNVCDVGAGTGYFSRMIYDAFPEINLTLIEPSQEMWNVAVERFQDTPVSIIKEDCLEAFKKIDPQDVIIFQRSLYSFSGNIHYYYHLTRELHWKVKDGGIVAVFELFSLFNVKVMHERLLRDRKKLGLDKDEFKKKWKVFKHSIKRFNQGVENHEFTLFNQKLLEEIFDAGHFNQIFRKNNYCLFKKDLRPYQSLPFPK